MSSSLTSSNPSYQAVFVGKERHFAPVNRAVDKPALIDDIDVLGSPESFTYKPDQTRFIPTYDKQQQLQNLTYTANGEFSPLQQDIIEAPKVLPATEPLIQGAHSGPEQGSSRSSLTHRQAMDAFQNIETAYVNSLNRSPLLSVDIFA